MPRNDLLELVGNFEKIVLPAVGLYRNFAAFQMCIATGRKTVVQAEHHPFSKCHPHCMFDSYTLNCTKQDKLLINALLESKLRKPHWE